MEWKKIVGMEYGKIVFHSIPLHALAGSTQILLKVLGIIQLHNMLLCFLDF